MAKEQTVATETAQSSVDKLLSLLDESKKSAVAEFIGKVGKESQVFKVTGALLDSYIADIDTVLSAQMNEIIHNSDFQELESTWRGLLFLVQNTEFSKPIKFELLDVTKEELYEDLNEAANGEGYEKDSGLWHHIYWGAYDKVGGHSYTGIVGDFQITNSPQDISLLQHLSILSESAQLPVIANAGHNFFGEKSFGDVMNNRFLTEQIKDGAEYTAWRAFRDDDRSKYIGLALPRFLGRLPYNAESEPTKNFNYSEGIYRENSDHSLWCNASYALASNMVRSFEKWGWSVKILGLDSGGKVENLPTPTYEEHGMKKLKVPVEASVGQAKDQELCDLGFIPLAHWDRTDYACFFEVPSVNRPKQIKGDPEATANYSVGARLQYTMLVTRIAHYLKYRQLTFIGKNAGAGEIERDLKKWLDTLVADFPNPPETVIAERPLRSYQLKVSELPEKPGFFQITAEFRPHVAITGMDINLRLIAFHSVEEK
ncbi:MAG: type VI secretion system contractile sheath large subunit [Ignavibacteria bacterium]